MTVSHEPDPRGGAFLIERDGRRLGELTYMLQGNVATIDHTFVDDELRGQGAGKSLVQAAVEWARGEGKRLRATCSYARATFERTPEFQDVLA